MRVIPMNCANCGGPLEVPKKARYITCGFCDSRLEVRHEGNAAFTEVLQAIHARTEQIADRMEVLSLRQDLDELDDWWRDERQRWMVTDKYGGKHLPDSAFGVASILFIGLAGIIMAAVVIGMGRPEGALLGAIIVIAAFAFGAHQVAKANAFTKARQNYQRRRRDLLNAIMLAQT